MQNEAALTYAVDEKKMTVIELSEAESSLWISKVMPIRKHISKAGRSEH